MFMPRTLRTSTTGWFLTFLMALAVICSPFRAEAQTGGEGGIQGTVTDTSGAAVPKASVTATNQETGVSTTRETTGDGLFTISPILPGVYTVAVKAAGFGDYTQKNLTVDALRLTGLNIPLNIGSTAAEVTVTDAPPALETTNATLGGVLENKTYENLPLQMSGQQRDPTAFATLLPGTQSGARAPIIGGTGNYLAAVYVDGIPVVTINQQGDNRTVSNALPVEAIDQFQVITSSPDAEYQGAGLINFTLKSGSDRYHGVVAQFFRARAFDAWPTSSKLSGTTVKPDEHQSETVVSGGGPIPFTKHKGYIYVSYDKFHGRTGIIPNFITLPTALMRQGNFSELLTQPTPVKIYDPTTDASCATVASVATCRTQFLNNTIPMQEISPITLKMQSFLPTNYYNNALTNNYLSGVPSGYDNWEIAGRSDFDLTSKQRLSFVGAYGVRKNVPFTVGSNAVPTVAGVVLPLPYTAGGIATIIPIVLDAEHAWQISGRLTNQLKFGYARFAQPITSLTDGVAGYKATDFGITGLPAGQASTEFPGVAFSTTTANATQLATWTSNGASGATQTTVPNTYTVLDNLLYVKGAHSLTFGFQTQWLQDNVASQLGPSSIYQLGFSANSTAAIVNGTVSPNASTGPGPSGFSYASFLLGAASPSGIGLQAVSETGGRYHDSAPYVEDVWKVRSNLTLNIGLRWDYLPPFHEVQDRWSFLNPNLQNNVTGNNGELQFAGNYGGSGVSCNCRTPVQTYWKNWGPRIGLSYAVTPTTVIRAGYGLVYSIGGGVGGRAGAGTGTGQTGFNTTATTPTEITSTSAGNPGPSYYLNNSTYFQNLGISNTNYGGSAFVLPALPTPGTSSQTIGTGNYVNSAGTTVAASGVAYADPYISGRAPEFNLFNAGFQQALTNSLTLTVNYAGTQSHFLAPSGGNARGYWTNQLDPRYLVALAGVADASTGPVKNPLLGAPLTPANLAILQTALPGFQLPYAGISGAKASTTVAQALVAFPQYSGVTDTWGQNVANISYNSLQASLSERGWHGLTYTVNYTWSRNIGDDGTFRSGYAIPSGAVSGSTQSYAADKIERSLTTTDATNVLAAYGVWTIPGSKAGNGLVRGLTNGWQVSTIYRFASGTPFVPSYSGCVAPAGAGTCAPDLNPNYTGNGKLNGGTYRKFNTQYVDPNAFAKPQTFTTALSTNYTKIGNSPRTAPYGLRNPYTWDDDIDLRRSFRLPGAIKLTAQVTCINVANHQVLASPSAVFAPGSTSFGAITGASSTTVPRDFQFSGRIEF